MYLCLEFLDEKINISAHQRFLCAESLLREGMSKQAALPAVVLIVRGNEVVFTRGCIQRRMVTGILCKFRVSATLVSIDFSWMRSFPCQSRVMVCTENDGGTYSRLQDRCKIARSEKCARSRRSDRAFPSGCAAMSRQSFASKGVVSWTPCNARDLGMHARGGTRDDTV